jgi:predicted nucleotidyltransferase
MPGFDRTNQGIMVMDQQQIINTVKEYAKLLNSYFLVRMVVLYGSYSRGTAKTDSDIDVAIFIDREPGKSYLDSLALLYRLRSTYDSRLEPNLFYFDSGGYEPASFENEILNKGIVILPAA